ncbi:MAG: DUF2029 domain-containing protein [Ruminococcaceae bacterium]|nr:DUF2029 domain-containing protein [Oscillospiraceae bacterium]
MNKLIEKVINNKKIFIIVICVLCLIIVGSSVGIVFLLKNASESAAPKTGEDKIILTADFDKDDCGFVTSAWDNDNTTFGYTPIDGRENSGCLRVSNFGKNDARYEISLDVEENSYYKISGWIKTEGIEETENVRGANISILNNFEEYEFVYGTQDWTYIEYYGQTAKNQSSLALALRVGFYSGDNVGTAWFDDVAVSQVSKLPEDAVCLDFKETLNSSSGDTEESDEFALDENFYNDLTKVVVILSVFVLLAFVIAYRFARAYDGFGRKKPLSTPCGEKMSVAKALIAIFTIGVIVRIVLALTPLQCSVDVNIFKYWGDQIVAGGFTETYNTLRDSIDYPPLYVYVLFLASSIKDLFGWFAYQGIIYSFLLKLTPIIADCIIGVMLYKFCDKKMSPEWRAFAVASWMFNPIVIIDSAVWGQVDSVLTLFVLLTLYYGLKKKFFVSGLWFGLGVMLKPQAIIISPIIFFMLLKYFIEEKDAVAKKAACLGYTVLGFITGTVVPCLPFMFKMGSVQTELFSKTFNVPWILSLFIGTANHYSYASVNSLNFWYLLGKNWVKDSEEIWNISLLTWGMAAIVIICVIIWVFYLKYRNKNYMPYVFAGVLYLCVTMFGPRMHERYFFPAVAFFAVAYILSNNRIWLWIYTALSAFGFLTVAEVLLDLEVGRYLEDTGAEYSRYAHYLWVGVSTYRNFIAIAMVFTAIAAVTLAILFALNVIGKDSDSDVIWKLHESKDNKGELSHEK